MSRIRRMCGSPKFRLWLGLEYGETIVDRISSASIMSPIIRVSFYTSLEIRHRLISFLRTLNRPLSTFTKILISRKPISFTIWLLYDFPRLSLPNKIS